MRWAAPARAFSSTTPRPVPLRPDVGNFTVALSLTGAGDDWADLLVNITVGGVKVDWESGVGRTTRVHFTPPVAADDSWQNTYQELRLTLRQRAPSLGSVLVVVCDGSADSYCDADHRLYYADTCAEVSAHPPHTLRTAVHSDTPTITTSWVLGRAVR